MNGKKSVYWIILMVFTLLLPSINHAEKLNSMMNYSIKNNIVPRLEKSEKLLNQGDKHSAKSYYESALQEWQTIQKDFMGKFDTNHPDIVAVQKRFAAIKAELEPAAAKTAPTPAAAPTPSEPNPPPSTMAYSMKQIQANLDKTSTLLDKGDSHSARSNLESANIQWQTLKKDFAGKFDTNHPDITAMQNRFDSLDTKLAATAQATPDTSPVPATTLQPTEPPSTMAYSMKQIQANLDKTSTLLDKGDINSAKSNLESANIQWQTLKKDFAGKFPADHPEIVGLQNQLDSLSAKLSAAATAKEQATPIPEVKQDAVEPPSAMLYTMKQIHDNLDKAEQYAQAQNISQARANLETAEQQWKSQKEWNMGKYDPQHAEIVAMEKKIASVKILIASASAQTAASTATSAPTTPTSGWGAPTAAMQYSMKGISTNLDGVQQDIDNQRLDSARDGFRSATQYWEAFQKDYRGQYDPQHRDIVALSNKYETVKANLEGLSSQASQATANLPAVLAAITTNSDALEKAYNEAYARLRTLGSLVSDGNGEKIRTEMAKTLPKVERVYDLMPDAMVSARDFRAQFPDFSTLDNLVKDGRAAGQKVESLEGFPERWLDASKYYAKDVLREAESNIQSYGLSRLGDIEGKDQDLQSYAADSAETHVIVFSSILLDLLEIIFPEMSPEAQSLFPDIAKTRQKTMTKIAKMREDIQKVTVAVRKVRKDVKDAKQRQLAQARFPRSEYHGGKWKDAEKLIHKAWSEAIGDKKLLKIDIYRPWEIIEEVRWHKDHWVFNTYRYIGANCLAKLPDGKYRVYRMNFRNTKQGNSWSKLKHWSVGHSYEILKENIDK